MVTREYKEKWIDFSLPTTGNAWYGLLPEISNALVELVGAKVKSSTESEAVFELPGWPGDLRITLPSGASTWPTGPYAYLQDATGEPIVSNKADFHGEIENSRLIGSLIVGVNRIGDFLNNIYFGTPSTRSNTYSIISVRWSWFISDTNKKKYWLPIIYQGDKSKVVGFSTFVVGSYTYDFFDKSRLYNTDFTQRYSMSITGNVQSSGYYPHDPDSRILCPIFIAARNTTTGEDLGYLRWGGEYMLYELRLWSSTAAIPVESGVKYEINGQTYVACGTTMLIPERWPFKEEGGA